MTEPENTTSEQSETAEIATQAADAGQAVEKVKKMEKIPTKPAAAKAVEPIMVEATVNLPDLARGERTLADPTSQWIKDHLRSGFLVRIKLPK